MDCGEFDGIDEDSSLRFELGEVHKDYFSSRQQEERNLCDSEASGDDLSNLEAAGSPSSNQSPSLLIVGRKEDEEEEALVTQFLEDGCRCNKSCCQLFDQQSL